MASSKTDLMYEIEYNPSFTPTRSSKVNVKTMIVQGKPNYVMKNHSTGAYFDLDGLSNDTWNLIDGKRTVAEITDEVLAKWKGKDESADRDTVKEVLSFFADSNCLKAAFEPIKKKRVRVVSAFEIDVTLIENSRRALKRIYKAIRPFLRTPLLWITLGFIVLNSVAFSGRFTSIFANSENFEILGSTVVGFFFYFFVVLGPAIIVHELAHALSLIHYGGVPGEIGTGLFYFGPMFYVDATDSWMLPKRQRIMVMMAGNISTLLIASIIVTWGFLWPFPSSISHVLYMAAFFCFYTTLMNLAPPFETDGYYVLADLVNVSNLREESYNYLVTTIKKALRRPTKENKELSGRKKKILLGYAILSGVWIVYTAYQTLVFTFYMSEDVAVSVLNISSAVFYAQALSLAAATISIASILYFAMTVAGYGVILFAAIKKAFRRALSFESIHDRDLCVYLYLPTQLPRSVIKDFEGKIKSLARKLTPNYKVEKRGPLHNVVLRIGGTKLPIVQVKEHLKNIESDFYSMYKKFLQRHSHEISLSIGINNPNKRSLTTLLKDLGHEISATGRPEAKEIVAQIIEQENQICLYLLNSVFSTVWTIELPPTLRQELLTALLPSFFAEDLAMTDLYGNVEGFKKGTIYGFDSLARLSLESRKTLDKALSRPEEYQTVCFFEPIRSRLVFLGRTEQAEKSIMNFGSLFVCQIWCGYLDSLMSETNLTLAALGRAPSVEEEELRTLSEGELFVLNKNLSDLVANSKFITASLGMSEKHLLEAVENVQNLKGNISQTDAFKTGLLDCVLDVNTENMRNLPKRFHLFQKELQNLYPEVERIAKMTKAEHNKRQPHIKKMKRRILVIYPFVVALSIALAAASFVWDSGFLGIVSAAGILLNVAYWLAYYLKWKSYRAVKKYPSPAFSRLQLLFLAFAQTLHKFLATSDVLSPAEDVMLGKSVREYQI